jgi:dipeptidyl aminopeptidase/acylaminoacyl peptidase
VSRSRVTAFAIASVLALGAGQRGPAPPPTEIYLTQLGAADVSPRVAGAPANISNNPGYDNQPSFTPDGKAILFSSNRDGQQTDIYRYDIEARALTQVTHTPESEYSPLVTPDGKTFSVVRVEADGTQRLWRFDLNGTNPRLVLTDVKPVGYHAWIDATHIALFVLGAQGQPNTLQIADTTTGRTETIASNIGRGLAMHPRTTRLTFVSKAQTPWMVREYDSITHAFSDLTAVAQTAGAVATAEDFVWDPWTDDLFMALGTDLRYWSPRTGWNAAGTFEGVTNITRLAIAPTSSGQPRLALVAEPVAK